MMRPLATIAMERALVVMIFPMGNAQGGGGKMLGNASNKKISPWGPGAARYTYSPCTEYEKRALYKMCTQSSRLVVASVEPN
jgi:hypothetical protein